MSKVIILLCTVNINFAYALLSQSRWEKITIPEAKCGRGHDYTVFIRRHLKTKLLVEFMGGGACWSKRTCVTVPTTWVYPMIELKQFSVLTSETNESNPFRDHSSLYFPFCTGDVFTGNHVSNYDGTKIYHYGYRNIILTLKHLKEKNIIVFDEIDDLIVWGASAGGIGALTHAQRIASLVPWQAKKTLIVDSPGLHFGPTFWDKFDKDAQKDFKTAFNNIQLDVNFNDGFVARKMGPVLDFYKDWSIGFLYGVRDWTMSWFFGEISKKDHEALLLGPEGLPAIASRYPHVDVWLNHSDEHRFLLKAKKSQMLSPDGQTAIGFAGQVYSH